MPRGTRVGGTSLGKSAPCPSGGTLKFQTASLKGPPGTQTQFLVFRLAFEGCVQTNEPLAAGGGAGTGVSGFLSGVSPT